MLNPQVRLCCRLLTRSAPGVRSWVCKNWGVVKCHVGALYTPSGVWERGAERCDPFSIFGSLLPHWQQPLHEWHDRQMEVPLRRLWLPPMYGRQRWGHAHTMTSSPLIFTPPIDKSWKYDWEIHLWGVWGRPAPEAVWHNSAWCQNNIATILNPRGPNLSKHRLYSFIHSFNHWHCCYLSLFSFISLKFLLFPHLGENKGIFCSYYVLFYCILFYCTCVTTYH